MFLGEQCGHSGIQDEFDLVEMPYTTVLNQVRGQREPPATQIDQADPVHVVVVKTDLRLADEEHTAPARTPGPFAHGCRSTRAGCSHELIHGASPGYRLHDDDVDCPGQSHSLSVSLCVAFHGARHR